MTAKKDPQSQGDQGAPQASGGDPILLRIAELEAALGAALAEAKAMKELAGRAQADLQNAQARMQREAQDLGIFAVERTLRGLLPVIDHFQRAFQHLPADLAGNEWVKGVVTIEKDFMKIVESMGLRRMSSMGLPADPERHEVLQAGPGDKGVVTEVFEEGYELHGKVLRPAKVKTGDGTAVPTP